MITITDKNKSFIEIQFDEYSQENDFATIYDHFSIKIPGAEFSASYKMGFSDGEHHFVKMSKKEDCCELLIGLKQKLIECCKINNIDYIDKTSVKDNNITRKEVEEFIDKLDLKFTPYKHQIDGVYNILKYESGIMLSATGSGKSLIIYCVIRYLIHQNKKGIIIVPSINLVNQLFSDFNEYFYDMELILKEQLNNSTDDVEKLSIKNKINKIIQNRKDLNCEAIENDIALISAGLDKHTDHIFKISTYQSLCIEQDRVNKEYFENIDFLIIDECHRSGAKSIESIIESSINSNRVGLTGSLGDDLIDNLKIEGLLGEVHKIVTMRELIDLGMATEISINPVMLKYPLDIVKFIKKQKDYSKEDKYIRNQVPRAKFLAKLLLKCRNENKNVLLIYKNNDVVDLILSELHKIVDTEKEYKKVIYNKLNDKNIFSIGSSTKAKAREEIRQFMMNNNGCILLGVSSIVATGLNIPNLHYIVSENIGKSTTLVIQALGRVGRLHESKKNGVVFFDIVDNLNYIVPKSGREYPNYKLKHFFSRVDTYIKGEYLVLEPKEVHLNYKNITSYF